MIPSRERSHKDQVYKTTQKNTINLLRGAVIYGSNASGKSNLVKAISYAKQLITKGKAPGKPLDLQKFKLDTSTEDVPTKFEFEIQCQDKMYAYGFELMNTYIKEEWLYRIRSKNDELIFQRNSGLENTFSFGKSIQNLPIEEFQLFDFVAKGTRENQLFLSETINRNLNEFSNIYTWFTRTLKIISPHSKDSGIEFKINEDASFKDYLTKVLDSADTGIKEINSEEISLKTSSSASKYFIDSLTDNLDEDEGALITDPDSGKRIVLRKSNGELKAFKLSTIHQCLNGKTEASFDLEEESDGTRRLIELTPALYEMAHSDESSVHIIDEIDRSLHPHLTRFLVREHLESEKNSKSQLIVTTHETSLLDASLIRRDEIWFIQKDEFGASKLYSLNNFQPRYDKDIRKDYLLGRYGAIPFVGDFRRLNRK